MPTVSKPSANLRNRLRQATKLFPEHVEFMALLDGLVAAQSTPYMVGEEGPFTSIQAAIDAAVAAGHTSLENPAVVQVQAGVYTENLALASGVFVCDVPGLPTGVLINGTVTCSVVNSGNPFWNVTGIRGLDIHSVGATDALVFTGATPDQLLLASKCSFVSAEGRALFMDNSALPAIFGSRLNGGECRIESFPGNTNTVVVVAGKNTLNLTASTVVHPNSDTAGRDALHITSEGTVLMEGMLIQGRVLSDTSPLGSAPPIISNSRIQTGLSGAPALAEVTTELMLHGMYGVTDKVPCVDGAGVLTLGTPICCRGGGSGVMPSGSIVTTELYQASTAAPASWATAPPTMAQDALDRITTAVSSLLGGVGIPAVGAFDVGRYQMCFGAAFATTANFARYSSAADGAEVATANELAQGAAPMAGKLKTLAWRSAAAAADTVIKIFVGGVLAKEITLSGQNGSDSTLTTAVAVGDLIHVEYDAGTAPGNSTWTLSIE